MSQEKNQKIKTLWTTLALYLGGAWGFIEAFGFMSEKYQWPDYLLDFLIIILSFGLIGTIIYQWFEHSLAPPALILHSINGLVAVAVIIYLQSFPSEAEASLSPQDNFQNQELKKPKSMNSLAILPLLNQPEQTIDGEYLEGIHQALIHEVGQISALNVMAANTMKSYKKTNKTIPEIAQELEVNYILEGTVLEFDEQIRIKTTLYANYPKPEELWSQEFSYPVEEVFTLYDEISTNLSQKINVKLLPQEKIQLDQSQKINPQAYKAYLKGIFHWEKLSEKDLNVAMRYFEQSLKIDSSFALAYAGMSLVWVGRMQQGLNSYFEGGSNMKIADFKAKALALDSNITEVYYITGLSKCWVEWEYEEAEKALKKAVALNPNFSSARAYLSHVLIYLHKPEEAMKQIEKALELDPFNPLIQALYAMSLNLTRQYDKAVHLLGDALETDPNYSLALSTLRTTYHMKGEYDKALEIWEKSYAVKGDQKAIAALMQGKRAGGYQQALEKLAELLIARSDTTFVTPWRIGTLYTRAGNPKKAIDWLEKAYEAHDSNMPYLGTDPIFDILRVEPRFMDLIKKMNLPEEDPQAMS